MSNTQNNPAPNPFQLLATWASKVHLDLTGEIIPGMKFDFTLDDHVVKVDRPEHPKNSLFAVNFLINVQTSPVALNIQVAYHVLFKCEQVITNEFLTSGLVNVNAKAIAFPFLRSFINTVTSNAGIPPLILPALNFIKRHEEMSQAAKV